MYFITAYRGYKYTSPSSSRYVAGHRCREMFKMADPTVSLPINNMYTFSYV